MLLLACCVYRPPSTFRLKRNTAPGIWQRPSATLPGVAHAADYAALTAGIGSFGMELSRTNQFGRNVAFHHFGSLAVVDAEAFPLLVESRGTRLVIAAAGVNPEGARCVAFAHQQFGHVLGDSRGVLYENAIKWAAKKSNPADITIGLTANLDAAYFASRGYQVQILDGGVKEDDPDPMPECDVVVADFRGSYTLTFFARLAAFTTTGRGVVSTFLPWPYVHGGIRPMFNRVNGLLQPFGLAYRSSLTQPKDFSFTNVSSLPYPDYFSAFPAADLLRQDRLGQTHLSSLEKTIAMHTITYASDGRPDLLAALTAAYSGNTNTGGLLFPGGAPSSYSDLLVIPAARVDATTDTTNKWQVVGDDLLANGRRGNVEYTFNVAAPDLYRLQVFGTQNIERSPQTDFDLVLSLDGNKLGRYTLTAPYGISGMVECLTPYLTAGNHTLKIHWDNASSHTRLRLQAIRVQVGNGPDSDNDGIKNWVAGLVDFQSGLDLTNGVITSYTSPICLEGRDPYLSLLSLNMDGADASAPTPVVKAEPGDRWYVNVPLANAGDTVLHVNYQNGAKSETKHLQWLPVNVLEGGSYTIRRGDSLVLVARPTNWVSGGNMQFVIGTNQPPSRSASQQYVYKFKETGVFTVAGTYTKQASTQTGNITVKVVDYNFTNRPACRVGQERYLDLPNVPPEVNFQVDSRLFAEFISDLPQNGKRYGLLIDQNQSRQMIARLGANGPVLDTTSARGFRLSTGGETYVQVLQNYADGSQLVEMLLVLSPVLPDVTVRLEVAAGGVTFADGTASKTLDASDFDTRGQCTVQFIRPAGGRTSVCHSIKMFQGEELVGEIR